MAVSMITKSNPELEELEEKIAKYRRMAGQVDDLTAHRIRSLIHELEQIIQQSKQS